MPIQNLLKASALATALSGLLVTTSAFAQQTPQTADLSITGTITPAPCTASFANNGEIGFGTIDHANFLALPNQYYYMGEKNISLSVACPASRTVQFSVQDLQSASSLGKAAGFEAGLGDGAADEEYYGLGTARVDGKDVKLGAYTINYSVPRVDGAPRNMIISADGQNWSRDASGLVMNNLLTYAVAADDTGAAVPMSGKNFNFDLLVYGMLNKATELHSVADDIALNGQAVFSIQYQ
ncbi:hypothetical protein PI87_17020 [Ralstonia sp. A12]|uniref:DUF1120 domain-containing protein n=1 Tax=Ralstonia sp. A12 TaxID=1217052 RepID=UPI00057336CC|nr:DUF1120 domain-containing protein [Ralstonia sp. A12]KHK53545.1 hypothetical protein PI87_17020 [Ralstonia sp. A12]